MSKGFGRRIVAYGRVKETREYGVGLLAFGFLAQSVVIGYLLTKHEPPCIQPQFNVGTTGNIYITQPKENTNGILR